MRRFSVFLAVFTALVFMVSCGDGGSRGELYGSCYPNKTCNEGLVCDEENDVCLPDGADNDSDADDDIEISDIDISDNDPDEDTGDTEEPDNTEKPDDNPEEPEPKNLMKILRNRKTTIFRKLRMKLPTKHLRLLMKLR